MKEFTTKGVRLTPEDEQIIEAIRRKLGVRNASEILRLGLRSLAREQNVDASQPTKAA